MEEMEWGQKSRALWLEEGDKNTKFFHCTTSIRRTNNSIQSIVVDGRRVVDKEGIRNAIREFFTRIFQPLTSSVQWSVPYAQLSALPSLFTAPTSATMLRLLQTPLRQHHPPSYSYLTQGLAGQTLKRLVDQQISAPVPSLLGALLSEYILPLLLFHVLLF